MSTARSRPTARPRHAGPIERWLTTDPRIREPATPLWRGTAVLRLMTWAFAVATFFAYDHGYANRTLGLIVLIVMTAWTAFVITGYLHPRLRGVPLVVADTVVTCALMYTSVWIMAPAHRVPDPLITTVWASGPASAAGAAAGSGFGMAVGLALGVVTMASRGVVNVDDIRDTVLLVALGLILGMAATMARRAADELERALRTEAATAERERLARSIHDSVLQVLARVRKRGNEVGGAAAELAALAGEQEIALRALVTSSPTEPFGNGDADLRARLQVLSTSRVSVAVPATPVLLPAATVDELVAVVVEALSNVDNHAGPGARAWVLVEDLGSSVVISIRDDGKGIAKGRLDEAESQGRLGVAKSMRGRIAELGGSMSLESAPDEGTEWEIRVPRVSITRRRAGWSAWRPGREERSSDVD